eukprot:621229_1
MFRQDVYNYGRTCTNCFYSIDYGMKYLDEIQAILPVLVDWKVVRDEWTMHRHHVFIGHLQGLNYRQCWQQFLRDDGWNESNAQLRIAGLALEIVCLASVNCERGFSLMNIIKTFLSNRLRVCLVSDLMTIKSSEWKLDYVVDVLGDEIIGKYNAMKERRCAVQSYTKPSYKEKKRKKNKKKKKKKTKKK